MLEELKRRARALIARLRPQPEDPRAGIEAKAKALMEEYVERVLDGAKPTRVLFVGTIAEVNEWLRWKIRD